MITVTDEAKRYIKGWLSTDNKPYMWLGIKSGGCAGFEYDWKTLSREEYEEKRFDGDELIPLGGGLRLIVDGYAVPYLQESTIDFERTIEKIGIVILNRFATNTCGCGKSVSF